MSSNYYYSSEYVVSSPSAYSSLSPTSPTSPTSPLSYMSQPMSHSSSGSSFTSSNYDYDHTPYQHPSYQRQSQPGYDYSYDTPSHQPAAAQMSAGRSRDQSGSVSSKGAYLCLQRPCADSCVGFARLADLQRHDKVVHNRASLNLVSCTFPGCRRIGDNGFTRPDKMNDHRREVHKVEVSKRRSSRDPTR